MILDELGAFLEANGLGTVGQDIFIGRSSDRAQPTLTVYELPGRMSMATQADPIGVEGARVQVMAKAPTYVDGRLLAERAYRLLAQVFNRSVVAGGPFYLAVVPMTPPYPLGRDQNDFPMFAFNCEVDKLPSPLPV